MDSENQYYTVSIKSPEGEELTLKIHCDADINDWTEKLKVVLKWVTFQEGTINEHLFTNDDFVDHGYNYN